MTAETLKPFISLQPGTNYTKSKKNLNILFICFSLFSTLFCLVLLGFTIWNSSRILVLEGEIEKLSQIAENLQKRVDSDLLHDLSEFEKAYTGSQFDNSESEEDRLLDIYNDDEDEDELIDDVGSGDILFDDESYDDLSDEENERPLQIAERKPRSLVSPSGVPIYGESYALRRNNSDPASNEYISKILLHKTTVRPTLKYDWSEKSPRKHKKYLESRAQPERVIHVPQSMQHHHNHHFARLQLEKQDSSFTSKPDYGHDTTKIINSIQSRSSRVMHTEEDRSKAFRQVITKSDYANLDGQIIRLSDTRSGSPPGHVVISGAKRRDVRPTQRSAENKSVRQGISRSRSIAIHFNGDTSRFTPGRHENYEGNGRLRHHGGVYVDWAVDPWVVTSGMERFFKMENGILTIKENGIYYIYAQLFYHDDHDTNGFIIEKNQQSYLQCTTMTHTTQRVTKSNTCFTSGVAFLRNGDNLRIVDLGNHRYTLFEPSKSFFGVAKLGDARGHHNQNINDMHDDITRSD